MNLANIKDTLTGYAAIAFSVCAAILGLPLAITAAVPTATFTLPPIVNIICGTVMAISIVITQVFTGKNPDGSTKTATQVAQANTLAADTKDVVPVPPAK